MTMESTIYKKGFPKGFLKTFRNKTDIKANVMAMFSMICNKLFIWEFENETAKQELESYIIEKLLFENGRNLFFEMGGHYFVTMVAERGKIDNVGRLVKARPITLDGTTFDERVIRNIVKQKGDKITIETPNAVLIKNNLYDLPTMTLLEPFIDTLNYIWQTLQINLSNSRVKRIIVASDPNQTNVIKKEINELINGVESVKAITDKTATDGLKTLEAVSNAEDIKTIKELYDWLYNWLLCYLGIDNMAQIDKQSGMTPTEIQSNQTQTKMFLNSMYEFRQKACEEINKLYNIGASVKFYGDILAEELQKEIVDTMAKKSYNDNDEAHDNMQK